MNQATINWFVAITDLPPFDKLQDIETETNR